MNSDFWLNVTIWSIMGHEWTYMKVSTDVLDSRMIAVIVSVGHCRFMAIVGG
jgi:hypothetical protein